MGAIPHHYTKCGGGAKNSGGRLYDKFKLIKNTFSVYLGIFNSGLLLISGQFLLSCPIKINFKASDRFKKNTENGYLHQSGSCHGIMVLSFHLKS